MPDHNYFANLIWQIADLLRGPYRPPQYERVMLPMTVLRRFDCVLAPTKAKVLAEFEKRKGGRLNDDAVDRLLNKASGQRFHNHSPLDFEKLKGDPDNIEKHLVSYIKGFSANVRRIFEFFEFENEIEKMRESNILYLVVSKISEGSISLRDGTAPRLDGPTEVGSGTARPESMALSQLIDVVNDRFGTDFNQADQLFFDQIVEAAMTDEGLRQAAAVNPSDKFELVFKHLLENLFVERMDQNEEIFVRFMNDASFQKVVTTWMAAEAYRRLRGTVSRDGVPEPMTRTASVPGDVGVVD